jgi:excinuclease ABC subunit C
MNNLAEKLKNTSLAGQALSGQAKKFPNSPGVYFFLDKNKNPIYIGRAGSLKKRIASYFRTIDPRIKEMVQSARGLKFQETRTLLEAIILEANLIKKYWPKYNIMEKDDKSFDYLAILKGRYPKVLLVRGRDIEKYGTENAKIFGPYQSYRLLKIALNLARKIFPFGKCQPAENLLKLGKFDQIKPCFDYQIGLCPGICVDAISQKEYKKNIDNLVLFFSGQKKKLLKKLKKDASTGSAQEIQKSEMQLRALEHVSDVALLQNSDTVLMQNRKGIFGRIEGYDISHLSGRNPVGAMVVFENGEKNPAEYRLFKIKNLKEEKNFNDLGMLREVLERRLNHKEWNYPDMVFVDGGLNQVKTIKEALENNNVFIPVVGLAKTGGHSASAYMADKLIIANAKKTNKEFIISSKKLFQEVRNEAHRFAIKFGRKVRN